MLHSPVTHSQHELQGAADAGLLGSMDANRGDYQNGWDTNQFPNNINELTGSDVDYFGSWRLLKVVGSILMRRSGATQLMLRSFLWLILVEWMRLQRALITADNILKKSDYKKIKTGEIFFLRFRKGKEFEAGKIIA
jgi:xylose isomerase